MFLRVSAMETHACVRRVIAALFNVCDVTCYLSMHFVFKIQYTNDEVRSEI